MVHLYGSCHQHVITLLADCMPLEMNLEIRYLKFYQRCVNSKSSVVKGITQMSLFNPYSTNASNYVDIINKYYMFSGLNCNAIHLKWNNNFTADDNGNIGVLKDMIDIRVGFKHCDVLDTDQVEQ